VKPTLQCSVLRHRDELEPMAEDWLDLYRASGTPNPFAHPAWVRTWYEHYVGPDDLYLVSVRLGEQLVAVAPFYRRRLGLGRGVGLRLAGMGASEAITEIPEILVAREPPRKVTRAIVSFLLNERLGDWDWAEITLGPRLGWFESDWIGSELEQRGARFSHLATLAFVVMELPESWETFRSGMKRNVKEAVRRSTNRLARLDGGSEYAVPEDNAELEQALDTLVSLHRARSEVTDKEIHGDYLRDARDETFLRSAAGAMFAAGAATIPQIRINGDHAASRLVLLGNDAIFFSLSGLERAYWDYGLGTAITVRAVQDAIERGDRLANLSLNPDEGKLRWSEKIELHNEFLLVSPHRGARTAALLYLVQRAARLGLSFWK
jgi:CelD/BcsL family acetyltransferase involved in cellulose biosynthesis